MSCLLPSEDLKPGFFVVLHPPCALYPHSPQNRMDRVCIPCHREFGSWATLLQHSRAMNHDPSCGYCHRDFDDWRSLEQVRGYMKYVGLRC